MRLGLLVVAIWMGPLAAMLRGQDAGAQSASAAADPELAALLAVLQEETSVATKTRLNSDFVPGLVTVLHGDELLSMGAETVWDALSMVPGLYAVRDRGGTPSVIVRGTEFPFNSGNVKVLVNGVALSREAAGINGIVLQIPLQQVERIEVIRGPGSVVYGDFAFMGLVNVVTRQKGIHLHARYGGDHARSGGVHAAGKVGAWEMGLTAAGLTNDEAPFAEPNLGEEDRAWGSAFLRRGGLSLTAQGIRRGWTSAAPGQTGTRNEQEHWAVDGRYGRDLGSGLRLEARAAYKDNRFATNTTFDGDDLDLGLDIHGSRGRHSWLAGVGYNHGRIHEAVQRLMTPPGQPPRTRSIADASRNVWSATLQDRFDVSDALSLTAGARFDDYSDVGDRRITPRAAIVWRVSEKNILKVQHAEGFRAPAFFELYAGGTANQDLGFEVNATTELNYVHRRPRMVARATLFRSRLRNMTFVGPPPGTLFESVKAGNAHGAEVELEQQIGSRLKVLANVSWVDQEDNRNPTQTMRRSPAGAEWLGNLGVLFRPLHATVLSARWNHVGRSGATAETGGYDLVDIAATRHDIFGSGLQVRAGAKNVVDADVRYIGVRPNGDLDIGHFPRRTFWIQVAWSR
jgi:outer membrane receptor for ferrienterochelin and colicins